MASCLTIVGAPINDKAVISGDHFVFKKVRTL